jgi:hypothetical protein
MLYSTEYLIEKCINKKWTNAMIHGGSMLSLTATAAEMWQAETWPAAHMAATSWSNMKKSNLYITISHTSCMYVCIHVYRVFINYMP